MRVTALVAAAGRGTRLGEPIPKAYVQLCGRSLVERSVAAIERSEAVDDIAVIVSEDMMGYARELFRRAKVADRIRADVEFIVGGGERIDSVWEGMRTMPDDGVVLVHDAARALTPPGMIARVVRSVLGGSDAVIPVLPVADTIKEVTGDVVVGTPDRSSLRAVQTPQGFRLPLLRRAYEDHFNRPADEARHATDDASLVERLGVPVHVVQGDPMAFKVTTPLDLALATQIAEEAESTEFEISGE